MKKLVLLMLIALTFSSCSLNVKSTSYGNYQPQNEVQVIQNGQPIPKDAIRIGSIETKDSGFTNTKRCTYSASIDSIIKEAKTMGGNIVYIVSVKEPSVWGSSCYYITADVYLLKDEK